MKYAQQPPQSPKFWAVGSNCCTNILSAFVVRFVIFFKHLPVQTFLNGMVGAQLFRYFGSLRVFQSANIRQIAFDRAYDQRRFNH